MWFYRLCKFWLRVPIKSIWCTIGAPVVTRETLPRFCSNIHHPNNQNHTEYQPHSECHKFHYTTPSAECTLENGISCLRVTRTRVSTPAVNRSMVSASIGLPRPGSLQSMVSATNQLRIPESLHRATTKPSPRGLVR